MMKIIFKKVQQQDKINSKLIKKQIIKIFLIAQQTIIIILFLQIIIMLKILILEKQVIII